MTTPARQTQIEYGDFQTPLALATQVCEKLVALGVAPTTIIEPTCGRGAFVEAAATHFPAATQILGVDINPVYVDELAQRTPLFLQNERLQLELGDFFNFDWQNHLHSTGPLLVLGNFPWVTNAQQGALGGVNLPPKINFQNRAGVAALTGKSNFDISEWMLLQVGQWFRARPGYLAVLVKTAVARKFLNHLYAKKVRVARAALYGIDAKHYFAASVEACLLFCEFVETGSPPDDYEVYASLEGAAAQRVGHRHGLTIRDLATFERLRQYYGPSPSKWRSGVKHDCAEVMELHQVGAGYVNGLGETVEIEATYLYPLLKGSDIANNRVHATARWLLVTQTVIGESTAPIQQRAPQTWAYLEAHAPALAARRSRIYQENPRFSLFGVGPYTFAPYKIAICGLYKKLAFRLLQPIAAKPVVVDDTVYFLSFSTEAEARRVLALLASPIAQDFYSALIFWDEKRPIKSSVLNSFDWQQFEGLPPLRLF